MKVSIIIPYNIDRGWLDKAVESVESQTYKNIELIVEQSDNLASYNFNKGIEKATGDYIKYLCEDDILPPNAIKDSVINIGGADFAHGDWSTMDGDRMIKGVPPFESPTLKQMLQVNRINGGTLLYKADVFDRFGLFDESLWAAEEYEYNLRLLYNKCSLAYINSDVFTYRIHRNQKSRRYHKSRKTERAALIKSIQERYK